MGGGTNLSSIGTRKSVLEKVFWFFEPVEGLGGQMAVRKRVENDTNTCHSVQRLRSTLPLTRHYPLDQPNGICGSPYMYEAVDLMRARSL